MRVLLKIVLWGGLILATLMVVGFLALFLYGFLENRHYANLKDTHDLPRHVEEMATPYVAKRKNVRLAVGITQRGKRFYKEFTPAGAETPKADGQPIYEIGSVTKVFTGILLARLENDGLVTLDQTIGTLFPDDAKPDAAIQALTLKHLATHTSGLPRLPSNLDVNSDNPYATYSAQQIYEDLSKVSLESEPGKTSSYSNYGMGLLGHLLARKSGKSYDELVQEKICVPLGMVSTTGKLNDQQKQRFVTGHSPNGKQTNAWDFDVLEGAGSLRSDVGDMLTFLEKNLHPPDDDLGKSLKRAQQVQFEHWTDDVGLGWQISADAYSNNRIHWHNGGTGGFISYVGFIAGQDVGVVVLSNYGDAFAGDTSVDRMGIRLLRYATKISLE
jgi:D-alanyl-D-alanine-carboxypeptidase/D-alanyl-D-alanine-endopeptidase